MQRIFALVLRKVFLLQQLTSWILPRRPKYASADTFSTIGEKMGEYF